MLYYLSHFSNFDNIFELIKKFDRYFYLFGTFESEF